MHFKNSYKGRIGTENKDERTTVDGNKEEKPPSQKELIEIVKHLKRNKAARAD